MPIRVLFTSLKHKLSVVQSSSKNLDLSRLLLRVISCESVIEMCHLCHAALANQRPENRWATNEMRDKAGCFSLWLYKILWEVAILIMHCASSRARAYRFSLLLSSSTERNENNPSLISSTGSIACHVIMSVHITIWTRVNTGTGRARVVGVYVLTPRVSIVSHFDEFGNNQWRRAEQQASLHWHGVMRSGACDTWESVSRSS